MLVNRHLQLSFKLSDRLVNIVKTTTKKRVRDNKIIELPIVKRVYIAEDENNEIMIIKLPATRDREDLKE
jgi:hypothetical protein